MDDEDAEAEEWLYILEGVLYLMFEATDSKDKTLSFPMRSFPHHEFIFAHRIHKGRVQIKLIERKLH